MLVSKFYVILKLKLYLIVITDEEKYLNPVIFKTAVFPIMRILYSMFFLRTYREV